MALADGLPARLGPPKGETLGAPRVWREWAPATDEPAKRPENSLKLIL